MRELYSAIEGITLPPDTPININTLSDVLFRTQRNDISFLINNRLDDKFKRKLEKIPKPEFIVLYNGEDNYPDYKELMLSDAFMKTDTKIDIPLELVVQVYNINKGRNKEILSKSRTLDSYSRFIDKIREYQKEYQRKYNERKEILDKAFKSAIKYCIKNNILKDFLRKHGSVVVLCVVPPLTTCK